MSRHLLKIIIIISLVGVSIPLLAHPMPNSFIFLSIQDHKIDMTMEMPVQEFELAYGQDLLNHPDDILTTQKQGITDYLLRHIQVWSGDGARQTPVLQDLQLHKTSNALNGEFLEITAHLTVDAGNQFNTRDFNLLCNAIIHQVSNHFAVVKIRQDMNNAIFPADSVEVGVIQLDIATNSVKPLHIQLEKGHWSKGFQKMVSIGMQHIRAGIDHLLFLFVLVLISPLLVDHNRWAGFGGWSYTAKRFLKIVTAFTIGHSLTLVLFSFVSFGAYGQMIERGIALTIIISAIHALRPLFYNKEMLFTFLFGLIHGSAFALSLAEYDLNSSQKFLFILGFNIGIELMQLLVILCFIPVIYCSRFSFYKYIRIAGAVMAVVAGMKWLVV